MQIEEILIIKNGSESYGISTEDINQISRVPSLMPLPLRPYGTRGLCGVGGNIVTMVDINLLLGMPSVDLENSDTRLISLNGTYSSNAILVSEVYNTVNIDENNIEYLTKDDDPIIAIYKYNDSLVQVISLDILFSKINRVEIESKEVQNGKVKAIELQEEDSTRFLIFAMENEKFALSIEYLREIILADISYTDIAGSPDDMLGLITLRDELVSVIDLRLHYGFKSINSDKNRILITSINDEVIGLLVDEIIDIKNYLSKDIEYIKDTFDNSKISGVIHDTESLISFFDKDVLEKLFEDNRAYINSNSDIEENQQTQESVMETIVFKLSDKEYAFEVDSVAEIIDVVSSTNVAYCEDGIDGIINIRGQIVTIVSLAQRLNINMDITEDSKIIVCNINGSKIGFVVDSISDILSIKADEIKVQEDDELFTNILHLDNGNRLVLSMDIQKIVSKKGI